MFKKAFGFSNFTDFDSFWFCLKKGEEREREKIGLAQLIMGLTCPERRPNLLSPGLKPTFIPSSPFSSSDTGRERENRKDAGFDCP